MLMCNNKIRYDNVVHKKKKLTRALRMFDTFLYFSYDLEDLDLHVINRKRMTNVLAVLL